MESTWTDRNNQTWKITTTDEHWLLVNGRYEPFDFKIEQVGAAGWPGEDGKSWQLRPVSAATLRELPLGQILSEQRRHHAADLRTAASSTNDTTTAEHLRLDADRLDRPRTRKLSPDELERVADVYRDALLNDQAPVRAVAEATHVGYSAAAKRIMAARAAGFLPPTEPGQAKA